MGDHFRVHKLVGVAGIAAASLVLSSFGSLAAFATPDKGNGKGSMKIDGGKGHGNDSDVGCAFAVEWTGFDYSGPANVTFESQSPTSAAVIKVQGPKQVQIGPKGSGRQDYVLTFSGNPHAKQGYHVKVFFEANNSTDTKVIRVAPCDSSGSTPAPAPAPGFAQCDPLSSGRLAPFEPTPAIHVSAPSGDVVAGYCVVAAGVRETVDLTESFDSGWISHSNDSAVTEYSLRYAKVAVTPTPTPTPAPTLTPTPTPTPTPTGPFDWNWTYPDPNCLGLTVHYPTNLPSGQANDVNIRITYIDSTSGDRREKTLNYHHDRFVFDSAGNGSGASNSDVRTWSGSKTFRYTQHPEWPTGVTSFSVVWSQVAGTNFHWGAQGEKPVECVISAGDKSAGLARTVTKLAGPASVSVPVQQQGLARTVALLGGSGRSGRAVALQQQTPDGWATLTSYVTAADGTVRVVLPASTPGSVTFRVVAHAEPLDNSSVSTTFTVTARGPVQPPKGGVVGTVTPPKAPTPNSSAPVTAVKTLQAKAALSKAKKDLAKAKKKLAKAKKRLSEATKKQRKSAKAKFRAARTEVSVAQSRVNRLTRR